MDSILLYELGKSRATSFISTWNTNNLSAGSSNANQIRLPIVSTGTYNFLVEWGDGQSNIITGSTQPAVTHTYAVAGQYTITITGVIRGWTFNGLGDRLKILSVQKWGNLQLGIGNNLTNYFQNCGNLELSGVTDILKVNGFTTFTSAFNGCTGMTSIGRVTNWNMSGINSLTSMFQGCTRFNSDVSGWDVSRVNAFNLTFNNCNAFNNGKASGETGTLPWVTSSGTSMVDMFSNCFAFNQDVGTFDTSRVTNFDSMFSQCRAFNNGGSPSIANWNTSACTNFTVMFFTNNVFNQPLSGWNTSRGTNFASMFSSALVFNQDIGNFDTSSATTMAGMFTVARQFNNGGSPSIANWNVSKVLTMDSMFQNANVFNQPLTGWSPVLVSSMNQMFSQANAFNNGFASGQTGVLNWNTSSLVNFASCFSSAFAFNQDISSWDVSKVTTLSSTFNIASAFNNGGNPAISGWNVSNVNTMANTFKSANVFNQPIGNWNVGKVTSMVSTFELARQFNQDLGAWDMSKVTSVDSMFQTAIAYNNGGSPSISGWTLTSCTTFNAMFSSAFAFNQDLTAWDVSKATNFGSMFNTATSFNNGKPAGSGGTWFWNVSGASNFGSMFNSCSVFNQNIGVWQISSSATSLSNMFNGATVFNNGDSPSLSGWNTSNVTGMDGMFRDCDFFNQNVGAWNTQNVTSMATMFFSCNIFNNGGSPSMSGWNVTKVGTFSSMFSSAAGFNQPLGAWSPTASTVFSNFLAAKTVNNFSSTNLDSIYIGWTNKSLNNLMAFAAGSAKYSVAATESRNFLIRTVTTRTVANATNNGSGLIRITWSAANAGMVTGQKVFISGVQGTVEANGGWLITVINQTTVDLQGSSFVNTFIAGGGTIKFGCGWTITDGGVNTMTTSLVASYALANGIDATGLSPSGTPNSITLVTGVRGVANTASEFNSINDKYDIPNNANFQFSDGTNDIPFSMCAWVYFTAFQVNGNWIINKRQNSATHQEWQFYYSTPDGGLSFIKFDKTADPAVNRQRIVTTGFTFNLNTWYHVAVTDNGTKTYDGMKLYVNGIPRATVDASQGVYNGMPVDTSGTRIGQAAWIQAAGTNHTGYLQDINIWKNRVLTDNEIAYISFSGKSYPFT